VFTTTAAYASRASTWGRYAPSAVAGVHLACSHGPMPPRAAYCTPTTSELYQHRYGPRATHLMPFGSAHVRRLHVDDLSRRPCVWSAMLMLPAAKARWFTGDFKLRASATAEPAARHGLMSDHGDTYGHPRYRLPPREESIGSAHCHRGTSPRSRPHAVVHAYVLARPKKSRESHARRPARRPAPIGPCHQPHLMSAACDLGPLELCDVRPPIDAVVVAPPRRQKARL